jgi:RND family efflux transporter MFP subunit
MSSEDARQESGKPGGGSPHRAGRFLAGIGIAAVLLAALGISSRVRDKAALRDRTLASAAPVVSVVAPDRGEQGLELVLPGNVQAFSEAPIYARTSGYVKAWYADIGSNVKKGQRLADIESPEVDQQLHQARADLGTAQANENLARVTADRLRNLVDTSAVSRQEYDNAVSALAARSAEAESARANVRRLEQLVSFERIEAPFAGVITARNTDVGQLVDAGSSGGPARELFRIATTDVVRVFVNVPQTNSAVASPGTPVDVTLAERPGKRFEGRITRTSSAIDPSTRTMLIEVDLDNASGEILPGAFAQVHVKLLSETPTVTVPASALLFRAEGPRVAVVSAGNRAALMPVTLGRDYGTRIEVTSGLSPDARVIVSPPDSLVDGQAVRVAATPPTPGISTGTQTGAHAGPAGPRS